MTTEPVLASRAPRGRSLAAKFAIACLLGIVLVVGVGSAGLYAYGQQYTGRILPGVRAGGVDLTGIVLRGEGAVAPKPTSAPSP